MKKKKLKTRQKVIRVILGLCVALIIALGVLIYANLGGFEKEKPPALFKIRDECSIVAGKFVHTMESEGNCKVRCLNECEIRDKTFFSSKFLVSKPPSCNLCECYCK
ncbi:hypothetical protein D6829_02610 [Candidatus Pacearchaeota archaeon]|nr:MAG: hypothetical protein D6829_02610 [Candidatus Pacearchaeota archaeon]